MSIVINDEAEKLIAQINRKHLKLLLFLRRRRRTLLHLQRRWNRTKKKVAIASAETHVFDQIKKPPFWASARPAQASARPGPASARLKIASKHLKHVLRMVLAAEAVRSATILKMSVGRRLRYSQIIGEKTWPKCPMVLGHLDLSGL